MSAIRLPQPGIWRPLIVKLYHNNFSLDPYADRLYSHGYDVINTSNTLSTQKAIHEFKPTVIILHDDPAGGVDALSWIAAQHTDPNPVIAMTPLIIIADPARMPALRPEEMPDRVIVLQNRADTLNQLTRTVKRTLRVWELDQPPA